MEFLETLTGMSLFFAIASIVITILLIIAIINTAINTKNIDISTDRLENLLEDNIKNQQDIINSLLRIEQQQIKQSKAMVIQLNKIIEKKDSKDLQEETTTL